MKKFVEPSRWIIGPFPLPDQGNASLVRRWAQTRDSEGWIVLHESGSFIRFTRAGADLFAS
jgi:hypothetical protein